MISGWIQSSGAGGGSVNILNPAALTANTNDYTPGALSASVENYIYISSTGAVNLTGIAGGIGGMLLSLINNGTNAITLINNATSTAANRFLFASGDDIMGANAVVNFIYDSTASRWRRISTGG